jgi:hypothetical protein
VQYENSVMTPELMAETMHEVQQSEVEGLEPAEFTTNDLSPGTDEAVHDTGVSPPTPEAPVFSEVADPNFDSLGHVNSEVSQGSEAQSVEQAMPESMAEPLDAFSAAETAFGEQCHQGLEALVMEAMPQPEAPQVQPDPFQQEQMMYDQQMQQLMAPFMMQGFGPGMMGPGFGPCM